MLFWLPVVEASDTPLDCKNADKNKTCKKVDDYANSLKNVACTSASMDDAKKDCKASSEKYPSNETKREAAAMQCVREKCQKASKDC